MKNIFFASDLHIGHKNILKYQPNRMHTDLDEHNEWIVEQWNSRVRPQDEVYCLGDIIWKREYAHYISRLRGIKYFLLGNHDGMDGQEYLDFGVTKILSGIHYYKEFWLTHCPIHPDQLRHRINIHGHVHSETIRLSNGEIDKRYVNVSWDNLPDQKPISLDELRNTLK